MDGKLIVVESCNYDESEKEAKKLNELLNKNNISTKIFSFPNYNNEIGQVLSKQYKDKNMSYNEYLEKDEIDYKLATMLLAADKLTLKDEICLFLEQGVNVICYGYVYSDIAKQSIKGKNPREQHEIMEFIEDVEFNLLEIPIPDIKIFLESSIDNNFESNIDQAYNRMISFKYFDLVESNASEIYKYVKGKIDESNINKGRKPFTLS